MMASNLEAHDRTIYSCWKTILFDSCWLSIYSGYII